MKSLIGFGLVIAVIALPYSCFGQYRIFATKKGVFPNARLESTSLYLDMKSNGKYNVISLDKKGREIRHATISYFDMAPEDQNLFMFRNFTYKGKRYTGMLVKVTRDIFVFRVLNPAPKPDPVYQSEYILTIPVSKYKRCAEDMGMRWTNRNYYAKKKGEVHSP